MGRTIRTLFLPSILPFFLAACATVDIEGFTDPAYEGRAFSSVMILGAGMSLKERRVLETAIAETFSSSGVRAVRSLDYFPPTRNYSDEEIGQLLIESNVETLLSLTVLDRQVTSTYVPPTYYPGTSTTQGTVTNYGGTSYLNARTYTSPGYTIGGYDVDKPLAYYAGQLIDLANGNTVWKANGQSQGTAFHDFTLLTKETGVNVAAGLVKEGLFGVNQQ